VAVELIHRHFLRERNRESPVQWLRIIGGSIGKSSGFDYPLVGIIHPLEGRRITDILNAGQWTKARGAATSLLAHARQALVHWRERTTRAAPDGSIDQGTANGRSWPR